MAPWPTFFWSLLGPMAAFGTPPKKTLAPYDLSPAPSLGQEQIESSWGGWSSIENWFAFGDSYSDTRFDHRGLQPSAANPMGNPPFPGDSSCNGTNWLANMVSVYNQSDIKLYNLAVGGATVNRSRTMELYDFIDGGVSQVHLKWVPTYANTDISWTSQNTLFSFWFGVNDIISTASNYVDNPGMMADVAIDYRNILETVYSHGARNILILYVPAFDTSPSQARIGPERSRLVLDDMTIYNTNLAAMAASFMADHPGTKVFLVDTYSVFRDSQDTPEAFPETAKVRNTTSYCDLYNRGVPTTDTFYEECGVPADQYYWHDELHPTATVHKLVARVVAGVLG